jgi:hypothetical protein
MNPYTTFDYNSVIFQKPWRHYWVTSQGEKKFLAIEDGYRESEQSWTEILINLKEQGFKSPRRWVHNTANILNKLPVPRHQEMAPMS